MRAKVLLSLAGAFIAAVALVSASGAATTKAQKVTKIDVSTRAAVVHYLRSIHVNPKGAVIQRGLRNYAGARCPGKGWTCAGTRHTVVQIAKRGGQNRFACGTAKCAVVQFQGASRGLKAAGRALPSGYPSPQNLASCIKTTGVTGSCTIRQPNASGTNEAVVWMDTGKLTGLTQSASYSASITQGPLSAGTSSNWNLACVHQAVAITGSTTTPSGSVTVTNDAHQNISIQQNSLHGNNTVQGAVPSGKSYDCNSDATSPLTQNESLNSVVTGKGSITQNQDTAVGNPNVPNVLLDIEQNQNINGFTGYKGNATGQNTAAFQQNSDMEAVANTPKGPVTQKQSSPDDTAPYSGLVAAINQDSSGVSTASATQIEKQCQDAVDTSNPHTPAQTSCDTKDADKPGYSVTQTQYGPEGIFHSTKAAQGPVHYNHKTPGDSAQTGRNPADSPGDSFTINQSSTQDNDTNSGQKNTISGGITSSGTGTVTQNALIQGLGTTDVQDGTNTSVNSTILCPNGKTSCTKTLSAPKVTQIPANPSEYKNGLPFNFRNVDPTVDFKCKVDTGPYQPCNTTDGHVFPPTTPSGTFGSETTTNLAPGPHTFSVETVDPGNAASGVAASASYPWTIVDANIQISPLSATNEVGMPHTFTGQVNVNDGSGWANAPNGTVISFQIVTGPGSLNHPSCTVSDGSGSCSVNLTSSTPGVTVLKASTSVSVGGLLLARSTGDSKAGDSTSAAKTWVDARIKIDGTATNEVGSAHTFTVTFEQNDGTGWLPVSDGNKPTVSINPTPGTVTDNCATAGTVNGVCTVVINSSSPGVFTANASGSATVGGVPLTRDTDSTTPAPCGGGTTCGPAVKTYVDARIKIDGTATNEVGSAHTFTVTFEQNDGTGWLPVSDGNKPTVSINPTPGTVTDNCATAGTVNGVCTVVINSSSPGVFTANASGSATVGGVPLTRDTDSTTPAPCGGGTTCGPAVKTYVDARIKIDGTATNEVGSAHTFTVTFEQNDGTGWSPVSDGNKPTVSINPTPGTVTDNCATAGTVNGVCTVVINSSSPGVFTANASGSATVGGVPLTRDTDSTTPAPCGGGTTCGPAVKTYVDARIKIDGTATNEVGSAHTFTVTFEQNDGTGWSPVSDGNKPTVSINPTPGTVTDNCATAGTVNGVCTVVINSSSPGVFTANASGSATVGGVPLTRDTDSTTPAPCGGGTTCGPAVKTYVDARIKIDGTATNEVGSAHTFTVTFEQNDGTGWLPVSDGNKPTVSINPTPGTVTDNCATAGTVNGVCTVVINSSSPGVFTANASGSATVGGVPLTRDTDSTTPAPCGGGTTCGPAVKTYVDANIAITPPTASNPLSQAETFTVTVTASPAGTGTPTFADPVITETPTPDLQNGTACDAGTINMSGNVLTCSVTVNSSVAATVDINASDQITMGGVHVTRTTGDGKSGDSADASANWTAPV